MIAAWMGYSLLTAAFIGAAAGAVDHALAVFRRPRRFVWLGAVLISAVLAGFRLLGARSADLPDTNGVAASMPLPMVAAGAEDGDPKLRTVGSSRSVTPFSARVLTVPTALDQFNRPLLALWGAGSLAWAALLVVSAVRLHRRRDDWSPEVFEGVPVYVSHDVGPALVGVVRYSIVVPSWIRDFSPARRRLILAHEREHARAGDPLVLLAGALILLAQPWNPVAWVLFRRLRLCLEADCDARVLAHAPDVHVYGELLLDVSERLLAGAAPMAALSEPHSHLAQRISLMTPRPHSRPLLRSTAALAVAGVLALVACQLPHPTSSADGRLPGGLDFVQYRWVVDSGAGTRTSGHTDPATGTPLRLDDSVALDIGGVSAARIVPATSDGDSPVAVMLALTPTGAARFSAATAVNAGRRIAVVIDGRVVTTAVVGTALGPYIPLVEAVPRRLADSLVRRINGMAAALRPLGAVEIQRPQMEGFERAGRPTTPTPERAIVRLTRVGLEGVTSPFTVLVHATRGARVGVAGAEPTPLADTLRLQSLPAMTFDVTDGDVSVWIAGKGRLSMEGEVSGGPAVHVSATGHRLVILRGGHGILAAH